ncbi:MAG: zinc ribbon domain-containing protein [Burkholderiaceae bacterium]
MPIFEYRCKDCGREFEALVRPSTVPQCPQCESVALDKLLSVPAAPVTAGPEPAFAGSPCGSCGHPGGPGACHFQQ